MEKQGSFKAGEVVTDLLDKPMRYRVYLPACYGFDQKEHYPVLYLLHGQTFDENQWPRLGLAERMDALIAEKRIAPFLVVMPFDYSFKQPKDYGFEKAFIELLLPRIEGNYRTLPRRAIGGLSRGGAWAFYIGTRYPNLFEKIGGHSPALFYSDMGGLPIRLRDLAALPNPPEFYIDAGNSDVEFEGVDALSNQINRLNLPHEWHYNVGFHDETYWAAHLENYLLWYSWDPAPVQ